MRKALIVGDANVDIIVPFPRFLNEERTLVKYPTSCMQGGGTSANTAVALKKLGVETGFIGTIGDDQYGQDNGDGIGRGWNSGKQHRTGIYSFSRW